MWVPFHQNIACRQVTDKGYGPQFWRIAVNILNKIEMDGHPDFGLGVGLKPFPVKGFL
jgi:hypothetical protein